MIKLFIFCVLIWIAFPREKNPFAFIRETSYPVAELYAAEKDHAPFDHLLFLNKRVKAIVEGPYVEIQSIYTYKNIMDHLVAAEFEFPQKETDISHKVEIRYQDTVRVIFDEANSPKKEFSKENPYTKERFLYKDIQAGNIRAQDTVEVIFTVIKPLEVKLNQFYELSIDPHHTPRFFTLNTQLIKRNYNIQVELRSEKPFKILANPTHHLKPELSNKTDILSGVPLIYKVFYNVTMENVDWFSQDFKIYFASKDFHAPQTIMATHSFNPHDHAFMFSLVPDMKYFSRWALENRYDNLSQLVKATRQSEIRYFPKEYLFVIDRSDSMKGESLENLKRTLNKILDTLSGTAPIYSILSFGNSSQLHWKIPDERYPYKTPEDTREIMKWVETIEADMGEKDLLGALKFAFEKYEWTQHPKNVIILTDGKVSNADEIIQLVQANSHAHKICAFGAEQESENLLRRIGEAGRCSIEIPWWSEYFDDRFLEVIDATFTPPEFNLAYEIWCENEKNETVHQEEGGLDGIAKDQVFIKWVNLNNIPNLKSCKANTFYYSQNRCSYSCQGVEIFRTEKAQLTDVWHKVAEHAKLHDELSKRKLLTNHEHKKNSMPIPFESQEVNQEELISHHEPQQKRSRYEIYQEEFNNLQCWDPKERTILSPIALSRPFFESIEDEYYDFSSKNKEDLEKENTSSKNEEEHEKENFSWKEEACEDYRFFSVEIVCAACVFTLLFVAACKIILK